MSQRAAAGGAPAPDNRALTLAQSPTFMFDTADATTRFQTSGGSTAGAGESVQLITDLTTNGYDMVQTTTEAVPIVAADGVSVEFDGSADYVDFDGLAGTAWDTLSDVSFFCALKTTDVSAILFCTVSGSEFALTWTDGSDSTTVDQNAGLPDYYVNETLVSPRNRDGMHSAIATGGWVLVEMRAADLSAWSFQGQFGRYRIGDIASLFYDGQLANPVLIPRANITNRAAIEAFVMQSVI
jgi:hypothetical protein